MSDQKRELFSQEAEQGVLGTIMLEPTKVDAILAMVGTVDFYFEDNAALFEIILGCHSEGMPVDAVTLGMARRTLPSGDVTTAYAGELCRIPSTANWKTYAEHLVMLRVLRQIAAAGQKVTESAADGRAPQEIVDEAQMLLADLRDLGSAEPDVHLIGDVIPVVIDGMSESINEKKARRLSTGLVDLDNLIGGGLREKTMFVIAGRPGQGKTMLGLQIAQNVAVSRQGVGLVFSMEMTKEELTIRALASQGGVSLAHLDDPLQKMVDGDWAALTAGAGKLKDAQLYLCDRPGMTVAKVRAIARDVQRQSGLSVVVIDYIGLMSGPGGNRTEKIAAISTALKNLAKELGVPVLVLAQLNRESTKRAGKAKKPQSSELRDTGQIEQDADMVLLVHRDMETEEGQSGLTELILDKGRQARVGSCFVQQQGQFARFVNFAGNREVSQEEVEMGRGSFKDKYRGAHQ